MKETERKAEFIELRANGLSYSRIAEQLHISKGTCTSWEKELGAEVRKRKEERLADLYSLYAMDKESRIKRLGSMLERIDTALEQKDLAELPTSELLRLKLKYEQKLREEYAEPTSQDNSQLSIEGIIEAITTLHNRQESGDITPEQAKAQLATLDALVAAKKTKENLDNFGVM